jgi:hypothetical protein
MDDEGRQRWKMNCKRYQTWLVDKALGALDGRCDAELTAHLAACPACRAALERERLLLTAIDRGVVQVVAAEPSSAMAACIRQRVAAEAGAAQQAGRLGFGRWFPVAVAATLAVLLGSLWLMHRRNAPGVAVPSRLAQKQAPAIEQRAGVGNMATRQKPADANIGSQAERGRLNRALLARIRARHSENQARKLSPSEPEVLVDKDEAALVLQIYKATRSGRVDGASLVALPPGMKHDADGNLVPVPLEIPPLEIAQLASGQEATQPEDSR